MAPFVAWLGRVHDGIDWTHVRESCAVVYAHRVLTAPTAFPHDSIVGSALLAAVTYPARTEAMWFHGA